MLRSAAHRDGAYVQWRHVFCKRGQQMLGIPTWQACSTVHQSGVRPSSSRMSADSGTPHSESTSHCADRQAEQLVKCAGHGRRMLIACRRGCISSRQHVSKDEQAHTWLAAGRKHTGVLGARSEQTRPFPPTIAPNAASMLLQVSPATVWWMSPQADSLSPTQTRVPGAGVKTPHNASGFSRPYLARSMPP